jgi:hypothetical protein
MDPMRFLYTTDDLERFVMQAVADRYAAILRKLDENRAVLIANAVARMLGGK